VALAHLVKNREITRLSQGYYTTDPAKVDYEQLACEIYAPSYLSLEWVLARAGILSQQPTTITLVTQKRAKKIAVGNTQITYQHIKPEMWGGYEQTGDTLTATPKKALLDWEYLAKNGYAPRPPYDEMNLSLLNPKPK
jgi:predicted transcriptional regulator of viral defense system